MSELQVRDTHFIANTYGRFPVEIVSGKGSIFKDSDGKKYIDLGTGIGVNAFGACDTKWNKAVKKQLGKVQHTSNLYYTEPCVELAEKLCERTGFKKVFFGNSGAEANECAIKVARKYGADHKGAEYSTIVTLKNSFHGRTITTLSATGQDVFHKNFQPLTQGFVHAEANDCEGLVKLVEENKVCAIMLECVQGEGGVNVLDKNFVLTAYEICQKNDILLIVDEVQTGNGRTGRLYAYMHYGIMPDVVTTAKGLGGGLPIGACLIGERAEFTLGKSDHGSTFGGNPVCSAGAISIIDRLDDKFLNEVRHKSKLIIASLEGAKGIKSVSGMGLMLGVETERPAIDVVKECIKKGVLCLTAKTKVRLLPALNITEKQLIKALEIIKEVCANV